MTSRSEALQVFLRVRPPISKEIKSENAILVRGTQALTLTSEKQEICCTYDHVFNELSDQSHVFEKIKPLLVDVLSGINSCIFAYGQTSAGKSFTMIGPNGGQDIFRRHADEWGILPRASEFLLSYLNEKSEEGLLTYEVKASFLQIYNENLYDLLRDTGPMIEDKLVFYDKSKDTELKIREQVKTKNKMSNLYHQNEVFVSGLSEFRVQTSEDILRILAVGTNNRMTRSTDFNLTSSRSHALLQLTFEIETQSETGQTIINRSKLNLVDLAGSEKIPFTTGEYNNTKHMRELTSINKSLSCLGNVIAALSSNNRTHIPYRDSKLTRILQDSLSGNTRTILIACVAPTILHVAESLSTLQFADRAKNVMLTVKANTLVDDKFLLAKAHAEITRLKELLTHTLKQGENKMKNQQHPNESMVQEFELLQQENDALKKDIVTLKKLLEQNNNNKSNNNTTSNKSSNYNLYSTDPSSYSNNNIRNKAYSNSYSVNPLSNETNSSKTQPLIKTMESNDVTNILPPIYSNNNNNNNNNSQSSYQSKTETALGILSKKTLPPKEGKNFWDIERFSLNDEEKDDKQSSNSKKKKKTKKIPSTEREIKPKQSLYDEIYKDINNRQIDELNIMLAEASQKATIQQQQQYNMMQYLQQQQYMQQNFPQQQQSTTLHSAQINNNQLLAIPHSQLITSSNPIVSLGMNPSNPSNIISKQNIIPQSNPNLISKNSINNNNNNNNNNNINNSSNKLQQQSQVLSIDHQEGVNKSSSDINDISPTILNNSPIINNTKSTIHNQSINFHSNMDETMNSISNSNHTSNNLTSLESVVSSKENPFSSMSKINQTINTKSIDNSINNVNDNNNKFIRSNTINNNNNNNNNNNLISSNSINNKLSNSNNIPTTMQGSVSEESLSKVPANRIVRIKPEKQRNSNNNNNNNENLSQQIVSNNNNNVNRNNTLIYDKQDIGKSIQLFSFRMNDWETIKLIDFEINKKLYKCEHSDGSIQWLDLSKKPIREL